MKEYDFPGVTPEVKRVGMNGQSQGRRPTLFEIFLAILVYADAFAAGALLDYAILSITKEEWFSGKQTVTQFLPYMIVLAGMYFFSNELFKGTASKWYALRKGSRIAASLGLVILSLAFLGFLLFMYTEGLFDKRVTASAPFYWTLLLLLLSSFSGVVFRLLRAILEEVKKIGNQK